MRPISSYFNTLFQASPTAGEGTSRATAEQRDPAGPSAGSNTQAPASAGRHRARELRQKFRAFRARITTSRSSAPENAEGMRGQRKLWNPWKKTQTLPTTQGQPPSIGRAPSPRDDVSPSALTGALSGSGNYFVGIKGPWDTDWSRPQDDLSAIANPSLPPASPSSTPVVRHANVVVDPDSVALSSTVAPPIDGSPELPVPAQAATPPTASTGGSSTRIPTPPNEGTGTPGSAPAEQPASDGTPPSASGSLEIVQTPALASARLNQSPRRPSGRLLDPTQQRLLATLKQSPSNDVEAQPPALEVAPFPNNLEAWEQAILAQMKRPVDKDAAAAVLNEIRFNPHKRDALAGYIPNHKELKGGITQEHIDRWNLALGLSPRDVKAMNDMAFWGGLTVPLNNTAFNAISFALVPMLRYLTKNMQSPWAQAGVGLGVVAAQPFLSSVVQTYAVAALEVWRQKNALSVQTDKTTINAKQTPREIEAAINLAVQEFRASSVAVNAQMRAMAEAHSIGVPADGISLDQNLQQEIVNNATPYEMTTLAPLRDKNAADLLKLGNLVSKLQATEGAQARAYHLQLRQILPRTLRSGSRMPSALLTGFFAKPNKDGENLLSPIEVTGISMSVAMVFQLLQHLAAGFDEVAGQTHDHMMNMLHADVFNAEGKAAWERGETILAEHLDEKKLRDLVEMPDRQMAKRVIKIIEGKLTAAEKLLPPTATEGGVDAEKMDIEVGEGAVIGEADVRKKIAEFKADLKLLREGKLTELTADGEARELLDGVLGKGFPVKHAVKAGTDKFTPLEFSSQLGQRIGQSFTFLFGGSAAAVALGPVLTAMLGGNAKVPNVVKVVIAAANTMVGAFAAVSQYMVVNIKNYRRDAGNIGFGQQLLQGVVSPVIQWQDNRASKRGLAAAGAAVSEAIDDLIARAAMSGAWIKTEPEAEIGIVQPTANVGTVDDGGIREVTRTSKAEAVPGA